MGLRPGLELCVVRCNFEKSLFYGAKHPPHTEYFPHGIYVHVVRFSFDLNRWCHVETRELPLHKKSLAYRELVL